MGDVLVNESSLSDIAGAIRSKLNVQTRYKPGEMAHAISTISGGGGITPTGTININQNGTHDVTSYASAKVNVPTGGGSPTIESLNVTANGTYTAPSGVDGYSPITVNVPSGGSTLQAKTNINPTTSSQTITADNGYDGLSSVQINAMPTQSLPSSTSASGTGTQKATIGKSTSSQYLNIPTGYNSTAQYYNILPMDLQSLNVTENGTYNASTYDLDGFSSVTVNVSGGGGSTGYQIAGGTFTPSSNVNTVEVDVNFEPTHAICYPTSGFDATATGWTSSWQEFGNVIFNTSFTNYLALQARINNGALQVSPSTRDISLIGYNNGKFKFYDGSYKFISGMTYAWYCWRETS